MEKYNLKNKSNIKMHNILFATTSKRDYEMGRLLLLEDMPDTEYNEFVFAFKDNPNSDYSYQFVISGNKYRFDKVTSGEINTLFIRNFV